MQVCIFPILVRHGRFIFATTEVKTATEAAAAAVTTRNYPATYHQRLKYINVIVTTRNYPATYHQGLKYTNVIVTTRNYPATYHQRLKYTNVIVTFCFHMQF
jgi:hypothetical protein